MQKNDILVSVIITTYKRSNLLHKAIESVLVGSYKNFEIIIIDDCSEDNTEEVACSIIKKHNSYSIAYYKQDVNNGVLAARNRGFDESRGDLVCALDDDDALNPDALTNIVQTYINLPIEDRGILWFDCIDEENNKKSGIMPIPEGRIPFNDYLSGKVRGDFWLVFERRVLDGKRFDERLRAHESLFWMQLHKEFPAVYAPIVVCVKAREHGVRLCDIETRLKYLPQTILAYKEYLKKFGEDFKRICPDEYGFRRAFLGFHQLMSGDTKDGRDNILASFKYRFSIKYVALYLISFFVSNEKIQKIYAYWETRS